MGSEETRLEFFLAANTPQGFVNRFDQLALQEEGWRCLVIKGGPGCGKSTLLRKVAQAFERRYDNMEYICCSSDVESLDAIVLPELKVAVADGTAPHAIEPKYPGAFESIIDMTGCWNENTLYQNREEIVSLYRQSEDLQEQCCRFLGAANALLGDTYRMALEVTDERKIRRFAQRLSDREFGRKPGGRIGREQVRFLSAVTNRGLSLFSNTMGLLASRLTLIEDDYGASSRILLSCIRAHALAAGYDIICCYCPLSPYEKLEHLFIPELSLGFVTANHFHRPDILPDKVVNARRFTDRNALKAGKRRMAFNRKAAAQMLGQAVRLMADGKALHDQLEECYRKAMDYDQTTAIAAKVIDRLESIATQQPSATGSALAHLGKQ